MEEMVALDYNLQYLELQLITLEVEAEVPTTELENKVMVDLAEEAMDIKLVFMVSLELQILEAVEAEVATTLVLTLVKEEVAASL